MPHQQFPPAAACRLVDRISGGPPNSATLSRTTCPSSRKPTSSSASTMQYIRAPCKQTADQRPREPLHEDVHKDDPGLACSLPSSLDLLPPPSVRSYLSATATPPTGVLLFKGAFIRFINFQVSVSVSGSYLYCVVLSPALFRRPSLPPRPGLFHVVLIREPLSAGLRPRQTSQEQANSTRQYNAIPTRLAYHTYEPRPGSTWEPHQNVSRTDFPAV